MFDKRWLTDKNQREFIKTATDGFGFGKAETCHECTDKSF